MHQESGQSTPYHVTGFSAKVLLWIITYAYRLARGSGANARFLGGDTNMCNFFLLFLSPIRLLLLSSYLIIPQLPSFDVKSIVSPMRGGPLLYSLPPFPPTKYGKYDIQTTTDNVMCVAISRTISNGQNNSRESTIIMETDAPSLKISWRIYIRDHGSGTWGPSCRSVSVLCTEWQRSRHRNVPSDWPDIVADCQSLIDMNKSQCRVSARSPPVWNYPLRLFLHRGIYCMPLLCIIILRC